MNDKHEKEMTPLGKIVICVAVCALLWCGAHLDAERFVVWLIGAMFSAFIAGLVAILESRFDWDFEEEEEEEE